MTPGKVPEPLEKNGELAPRRFRAGGGDPDGQLELEVLQTRAGLDAEQPQRPGQAVAAADEVGNGKGSGRGIAKVILDFVEPRALGLDLVDRPGDRHHGRLVAELPAPLPGS